MADPETKTLWKHIMEVKNAFSPGGPAYVKPMEGMQEIGSMQDVMSISPNPPEPGRNLLNPQIPGTRAFTERVDAWEPPNPLTTKASENYMYDVGAVAPIAYHGTPHKFDKFDVSKVGTGQGAQSYGHGLYFAENPKVAGEYRKLLAERSISYKGKDLPKGLSGSDFIKNYTDDEIKALQYIDIHGGPDDAIEALSEKHKLFSEEAQKGGPFKTANSRAAEMYKSHIGLVNRIKKDVVVSDAGAVIKADIKPSTDKFLDWYKPFSEQSDHVKSKLTEELRRLYPKTYKEIIERNRPMEELYYRFGVTNSGVDMALASKKLNELGIPGIRYLDQGSREAGKGTYNYVVFSDKDLEILK